MPRQVRFDFGQGELIAWLDARTRHEMDSSLGSIRQLRAHAYKILTGFCKMPPIHKWWPLEGDEEIVKQTEHATQEISAKEFVALFGAAFRGN